MIKDIVKNKKTNFKMDTDWIFTEPIDLEHKQYMLLDFLKYCDKKIDKFELYPMYTELSVHLANLQSISSDFKMIYFERKLENVDDEVLLSDLKFRPIQITNEEDLIEYDKILKYSGQKILDYFNIVKALWTLIYDTVSIKIIKNDRNISELTGYFFYEKEGTKKIWKYIIDKKDNLTIDNKVYTRELINFNNNDCVESIIYNSENVKKLPIFELKATNEFPMESTLLPIFKRKVLNYIIQKGIIKNLRNGVQ